MYDASVAVARGIMPGSLQAVLRRHAIVNMNRSPPTIGMKSPNYNKGTNVNLHSKTKNGATVRTIKHHVRCKIPVCRAMIILPSQKNLFLPGLCANSQCLSKSVVGLLVHSFWWQWLQRLFEPYLLHLKYKHFWQASIFPSSCKISYKLLVFIGMECQCY